VTTIYHFIKFNILTFYPWSPLGKPLF